MKTMIQGEYFRRGSRRSRRGAHAVEFALVAPVLFLVIMGVMEFGWFFCHALLLDTCTTQASRMAGVSIVNDSTDVGVTTRDWEQSGVECWERFGLPGDAAFTTSLQTSSGVFMAHVTGTVNYAAILPGYFSRGQGGGVILPNVLDTTVATRVEQQDLGTDITQTFP